MASRAIIKPIDGDLDDEKANILGEQRFGIKKWYRLKSEWMAATSGLKKNGIRERPRKPKKVRP